MNCEITDDVPYDAIAIDYGEYDSIVAEGGKESDLIKTLAAEVLVMTWYRYKRARRVVVVGVGRWLGCQLIFLYAVSRRDGKTVGRFQVIRIDRDPEPQPPSDRKLDIKFINRGDPVLPRGATRSQATGTVQHIDPCFDQAADLIAPVEDVSLSSTGDAYAKIRNIHRSATRILKTKLTGYNYQIFVGKVPKKSGCFKNIPEFNSETYHFDITLSEGRKKMTKITIERNVRHVLICRPRDAVHHELVAWWVSASHALSMLGASFIHRHGYALYEHFVGAIGYDFASSETGLMLGSTSGILAVTDNVTGDNTVPTAVAETAGKPTPGTRKGYATFKRLLDIANEQNGKPGMANAVATPEQRAIAFLPPDARAPAITVEEELASRDPITA